MIPLRNVVAFVALSGILIEASAQEPTIADCAGSVRVCIDTTFSESPGDSGTVADLGAGNHGCMESNERQGVWVRFTTNATGTVAFTINPTAGADYDLALWGPYAADPVCPTQAQPIRCSFSAINGGTGLNYTAVDLSEGAGGNSWVRYLDV